jgi:MFS family permease
MLSPTRAWYATVILMLIYASNFVDRQIIALLVQPIRRDLHISDTGISLLHGFAFVLFYTLLGLPFGRLADRVNRRTMVAAGTATWSIATALCGGAGTFATLFLARIGVGVGEATLSPAAYSMLTDSFPRQKLGRALSIYHVGVTLGQGLALLVGGTIIKAASASETMTLPLIGVLRTWQAIFVIVGLPGLVLALIMITTVREPARQGIQGETRNYVPAGEAWRFLKRHMTAYGLWIAGYSLFGFVLFGFSAWIPTTIVRTFGLPAGDVGQRFGALLVVLGTAAMLGAGWIADRMIHRGIDDANERVAMFMAIAALPFIVSAPLVSNANLAIVLFACALMFTVGIAGISAAVLQSATPNRLRGQIAALNLLCAAIVGGGFGPTAVALLTDYVFGRDTAVGYSLLICGSVALPLACLCFWTSRPGFARLRAGFALDQQKESMPPLQQAGRSAP